MIDFKNYEPIATNQVGSDDGGLIFNEDRYCRFDGVNWGELDDCVTSLPGFGYKIQIPGRRSWIKYEVDPRSVLAIEASIHKDVVGRNMGPILRLIDAPDDLIYRVTVSSEDDVRRLPNDDIELEVIEGKSIGLGFDDVSDIATHDIGEVRLNLRQRKADAALRGDEFINLDPTIDLDPLGGWHTHTADDGVWDTVRDKANADRNLSTFGVEAFLFSGTYTIGREITKWNTAGIPTPASVTLKLNVLSLTNMAVTDVHVSFMATAISLLSDTLNYSHVKTGYLTDPIGFLDADGNIEIPTSFWGNPLFLSLAAKFDQNGGPPTPSEFKQAFFTVPVDPDNENEPVLEYFHGSPGIIQSPRVW